MYNVVDMVVCMLRLPFCWCVDVMVMLSAYVVGCSGTGCGMSDVLC